jgi:hypothetical protein
MPGGSVQNGQVLRFSAWLASAVDDPYPLMPVQQDDMKFEFWDTALSLDRTNDLLYDSTEDGLSTHFQTGLSTFQWTQFVFELVIDDTQWAGGGNVGQVQEIRTALFTGHFDGTSGWFGSYYLDRLIVEAFPDQATANANPVDTTYPGGIPEPTSLALLALGGLAVIRRRRS